MDYPTQSSLSFTISLSLLRYMSVELVMPSNHLILCCPLHLLPSVYPSITVFPSESALCIRWPKCWSFSFNIRPSNEYSGLISFKIDWFDLLDFQGTLMSLYQHHSLKTSILWLSDFFFVFLYCLWKVLKARMLKWFAIPSSSGPCFVRTLHYNPSILAGPIWHGQ